MCPLLGFFYLPKVSMYIHVYGLESFIGFYKNMWDHKIYSNPYLSPLFFSPLPMHIHITCCFDSGIPVNIRSTSFFLLASFSFSFVYLLFNSFFLKEQNILLLETFIMIWLIFWSFLHTEAIITLIVIGYIYGVLIKYQVQKCFMFAILSSQLHFEVNITVLFNRWEKLRHIEVKLLVQGYTANWWHLFL